MAGGATIYLPVDGGEFLLSEVVSLVLCLLGVTVALLTYIDGDRRLSRVAIVFSMLFLIAFVGENNAIRDDLRPQFLIILLVWLGIELLLRRAYAPIVLLLAGCFVAFIGSLGDHTTAIQFQNVFEQELDESVLAPVTRVVGNAEADAALVCAVRWSRPEQLALLVCWPASGRLVTLHSLEELLKPPTSGSAAALPRFASAAALSLPPPASENILAPTRSYTDFLCIPRLLPSSTTSSRSHGLTGGSKKPFTLPMCPSPPPTPVPATSLDCSDGNAQLLTTPMRHRGSARTAANAALLILPARLALPMWAALMPVLCAVHPLV